jgi:hypothetical protein
MEVSLHFVDLFHFLHSVSLTTTTTITTSHISTIYVKTTSCTGIQIMIMDCPIMITTFDLKGLQRLHTLDVKAPYLTYLNLHGCKSLNNCHIDCPRLQYVTVVGCRMVALRYCKTVRRAIIKSWSNNC